MTVTLGRPDQVTVAERPIRTVPGVPLTRQTLRTVLGVMWLLDGALQLQSYMFTRGFARQIIAPTAAGQPLFVSGPVRWNAELIAHQPVLFDAVFAGIQLAIGIGLLLPRTWRLALVGSVLWAGGVWYLGEGLGGVAGGHSTALVGAPGAAVLYIVLALAAWPASNPRPGGQADGSDRRPPHWLVSVWAVLWVGAGLVDLLPGNHPASAFPAQLSANSSSVPAWLGDVDRWLGSGVHALGGGATALVVGVELAIGLASLGRRPIRTVAIGGGIVLAAVYWGAGESFGMLFSGQATDPNTGPLLMVIGLAALAAAPGPRHAARAAVVGPHQRWRAASAIRAW